MLKNIIRRGPKNRKAGKTDLRKSFDRIEVLTIKLFLVMLLIIELLRILAGKFRQF